VYTQADGERPPLCGEKIRSLLYTAGVVALQLTHRPLGYYLTLAVGVSVSTFTI